LGNGELTKRTETAIDEGIFVEIEIGVQEGKVVATGSDRDLPKLQ